MSLSETEKNKRAAAARLLYELNHEDTTRERKLEIFESTMRANPEAFIQVARIHLEATAFPKYQEER